jgi:hypothetical protein
MRVYSVKKLLHVSSGNRKKTNMHTTTIKNNMNSTTKNNERERQRERHSKKLVILILHLDMHTLWFSKKNIAHI